MDPIHAMVSIVAMIMVTSSCSFLMGWKARDMDCPKEYAPFEDLED